MNAYAKARKLAVLMEARDRIRQLLDPDLKLEEQIEEEIRKVGVRKEEVDSETGEIR